MPIISTLVRTMVSALQRLHQNQRQNQEVDLLYASILCLRFVLPCILYNTQYLYWINTRKLISLPPYYLNYVSCWLKYERSEKQVSHTGGPKARFYALIWACTSKYSIFYHKYDGFYRPTLVI